MVKRIQRMTTRLLGFAVLFSLGAMQSAQGQWTEPVPMEPNFGTAMRAVWISNDGLRLYLSAGLDAVGWTERDSIGGPWSQWAALPPQVNASNTQTSMCESPSGDTLYFTSNSDERPDGGFGWMDIYYCVRTDTGWGPAVNAGPNVNGTGREWSVNISRDGSMLLVAGQIPGDASHSLYYCLKQEDGTWGPKISFGASVNTVSDQEHPSLSSDNTYLYYYTVGPNGGDIWASERIGGVWSEGTQLPAPVNSFEREMNPCIANDGRTLWYRKGTAETGFRIVTSVDTTVSSIGRPAPSHPGNEIRIINSASTSLEIELLGPRLARETSIEIHNILGQTVFSHNITRNSRRLTLTFPQLSTGIYWITVRLPEQNVTSKFQIIH